MIMNTEYPVAPGYKKEGTSQIAAGRTRGRAVILREAVLQALRTGDMTADECAKAINETPFSVRPRFSELLKLGKIETTGARRKNESGHTADVWRVKRIVVQPDLL
jgi:predicted ArsR family transcriptional regulator